MATAIFVSGLLISAAIDADVLNNLLGWWAFPLGTFLMAHDSARMIK